MRHRPAPPPSIQRPASHMPMAGAPQAGTSSPEVRVRVAPFWLRTVALLLDGLPILTIWALVLLATGLGDPSGLPGSRWNAFDMVVDLINEQPWFLVPPFALLLSVVLGYFLACELTIGVSVGQRLLNLTLVDAHGHRPHAVQILVRNLIRLLGMVVLMWGYLWAGFDTERRTLHDWLSGTWLVYRTPRLPVARSL